jgi:hypothetical protein
VARIIKPPDIITISTNKKSIFLAGSIEMGKAEDWQTYIGNKMADYDIVICNPRRDSWDSSWEQSIDNPKFKEQVDWEMDALEKSDCIFFHFEPGTKSPISLLELGLHAESGKCIVHCPEGFWRKGNVDIVCSRYNIKQIKSIDEGIMELQKMFGNCLL